MERCPTVDITPSFVFKSNIIRVPSAAILPLPFNVNRMQLHREHISPEIGVDCVEW